MARLQTFGYLAVCVLGIYASYLTQGVVQERLSTTKYGLIGARFAQMKSLNGIQSLTCFLWAALLVLPFKARRAGAQTAPWTAYWRAAVTNSVGPACGYEALKNISYPAQVLAKSCKMVPVMVLGTIIGGKRYSVLEYICSGLIGGGISLFAAQSMSGASKKLSNPNAPLGYALCAVNLILDGYTNAAQDKIHAQYKGTSSLVTMCWMNFWCSIYNAAFLFIFSSSGYQALFIFETIREFGSLTNTMITTTRKFFNILLSVLWNGNALAPQQWAAVFMVFSGLLTSSYLKGRRHSARPDKVKTKG
ncbi:hypothetical protein WJX84_005679 [Apatococcus fuscideae]|uniref:UAA transporter n=1 Tax=Apatococcus fuscideae TaxID=2026836 RepID=A0AAW1SXK9_9CHLO